MTRSEEKKTEIMKALSLIDNIVFNMSEYSIFLVWRTIFNLIIEELRKGDKK